MVENMIDVDMQIESIKSATRELKKHFGKHYELGALTYSIPLLKELKELRKGRKEIPIATIEFSKEDMQKIVDEKVAQIELDIQEIRTKTIDEFVNTLTQRLTDAIYRKDVESMTNLINDVARELKAGDT